MCTFSNLTRMKSEELIIFKIYLIKLYLAGTRSFSQIGTFIHNKSFAIVVQRSSNIITSFHKLFLAITACFWGELWQFLGCVIVMVIRLFAIGTSETTLFRIINNFSFPIEENRPSVWKSSSQITKPYSPSDRIMNCLVIIRTNRLIQYSKLFITHYQPQIHNVWTTGSRSNFVSTNHQQCTFTTWANWNATTENDELREIPIIIFQIHTEIKYIVWLTNGPSKPVCRNSGWNIDVRFDFS